MAEPVTVVVNDAANAFSTGERQSLTGLESGSTSRCPAPAAAHPAASSPAPCLTEGNRGREASAPARRRAVTSSRPGRGREAFAGAPFEPFPLEPSPHEHVQNTDQAIAYLLSISGFALLPEPEREEMRAELRKVLPQTTWRTPLQAEIWPTRRRD